MTGALKTRAVKSASVIILRIMLLFFVVEIKIADPHSFKYLGSHAKDTVVFFMISKPVSFSTKMETKLR